jgi:hypothetical protein
VFSLVTLTVRLELHHLFECSIRPSSLTPPRPGAGAINYAKPAPNEKHMQTSRKALRDEFSLPNTVQCDSNDPEESPVFRRLNVFGMDSSIVDTCRNAFVTDARCIEALSRLQYICQTAKESEPAMCPHLVCCLLWITLASLTYFAANTIRLHLLERM